MTSALGWRAWRRGVKITTTCACVSALLMFVTGHDQGVHDNWFGIVLFMVLLLAMWAFALFAVWAILLGINTAIVRFTQHKNR